MKRTLLIACCAATALAQAQPPQLGRLFSSPEERAQLDASRSGTPPAGTAQAPPSPPPPPPPGPPMELNGLVQRSSGRSTVWLNQTPQQEPYNQVSGASQLTLRLSNGQVVVLKPGQQYDAASGTVMETRP